MQKNRQKKRKWTRLVSKTYSLWLFFSFKVFSPGYITKLSPHKSPIYKIRPLSPSRMINTALRFWIFFFKNTYNHFPFIHLTTVYASVAFFKLKEKTYTKKGYHETKTTNEIIVSVI